MPPLVYLVRRGVKEAMEAKADLLVLDMETNGGRVDTTREIISILNEFKGDTVTFVNKDAFSAGAFIAVATKRIYMAPESVITTLQSGSFAMATMISNASPSARPEKAVWLMPRKREANDVTSSRSRLLSGTRRSSRPSWRWRLCIFGIYMSRII